MNYLSIEFGLLFIIFFTLYWAARAKPKLQNRLLLITSYAIICSYSWLFGVILFAYTCGVFLFSILIFHSKQYAGFWLSVVLGLVVANLVVFKYFDFFRYELQTLLNVAGLPISLPVVTILVPIGISFYTFHSVSYLVSIYKKELPSVHFFDLTLFLAFFPSVIAGPINRAKHFLPQIAKVESRQILEPHRAFVLIILAIIKVYCVGGFIDDNWINPIFSNPLEFSSLDLLFGLYAYAMLIYFNFSGYTDLVTGIALLLGFRLPSNFNSPYLATNLRDFWTKWHISLSNWIRDYIYIPFGGSRDGFIHTQINVMLAMLLSGLWHGVGFNFIVWAAFHGIGMVFLNVVERYFGKNLISRHSLFASKLLTIHYVCFAWLFFYCVDFNDSMDYLSALINNVFVENHYIMQLLGMIALYFTYPWLKDIPHHFIKIIQKMSYIYLPFVFIIILWVVIFFAPSGVPNFIYASF